VSYTIIATEFPTYGTNFAITNCEGFTNSFCFTWTSLPGLRYYVEGKTNLNDTQWVSVSPTITASDVLTTFCVPLPSPCQFFRVGEGLVVTSSVAPLRISSRRQGLWLNSPTSRSGFP